MPAPPTRCVGCLQTYGKTLGLKSTRLVTARLDSLRVEDARRKDLEFEYINSNQLSLEFPSEFSRICGLIQDAATGEPPFDGEPGTIQINLSKIVYRHRNRHSRSSGYFDRISAGAFNQQMPLPITLISHVQSTDEIG